MNIRPYNPETDRRAAVRVWQEVGWLEKDDDKGLDYMLDAGEGFVGELNGEVESLVTTAPGSIRYLEEKLPFSCVSGVTTSRVARKQGLARRVTARAVAHAAAEGALIAGLGMFEQGFYNQLGFGTGNYIHRVTFDPATLQVPVTARIPQRLGIDDWETAHAARLNRRHGHGFCDITSAQFTRADMKWTRNGFGLGYFDGPNGELTHYFWCGTRAVEQGPYRIGWIVYQNWDQFLELMALIKGLGDQIRAFVMIEPPGLQLQDLLQQPNRFRQISTKSEHAAGIRATAYWQMRINDLPGCLQRTHLPGTNLRFNLTLTDPIAQFLDEGSAWRDAGGEYVVQLGKTSWAEEGQQASLPTLTAAVGAFTRLWLGMVPASGLAATDDLAGPVQLLLALEEALRLPSPHPDWIF